MNKPETIVKKYNLVTGLSDHNMILIARKLKKKRLTRFINRNQNSFKLEIPLKKLTEFEIELKGVNWDELQQYDQVNDCCNKLMSTFGSIVDKYIKKRKKSQRKFQLPWMNDNIRKLMKRRDHALKTFIKTRRDIDLELFKGLRNKVIKELIMSKSNDYIQALSEAKGNGKIIWKQLNSLLNPKGNATQNKYELKMGENIITDSAQVAEKFNNFFIQYVNNFASSFPSRNDIGLTTIDLLEDQDNSFQLREVCQTAVLKAIQDLNTTFTKDIYNLDTALLKKEELHLQLSDVL
ncbi:hypothetical protein F2P81_010930 [Scophthalmus maximus]|uniref:Uncharacterized protein n=1 Tax=Scophthalmus maximus TaxID=52904 RepID=A0A6A4SS79_SCOMX|nr:hypothetical protein F2P81_010930 [Scophthalmus maximus]